ncbi:ATP phosphoribosyltransferase regulatory subunit [Candidatus Nomurabacteria bacterium]|nr:ATP phosphoribosyltransferase regulatory subunit [Candidatus Nomurabacteria bacterium]
MQKKARQISNAYLISKYFGFDELASPTISVEERQKAKSLKKSISFSHELLPSTEEVVTLLNNFKESLAKINPSEPLMLYCEGGFKEDKGGKVTKLKDKKVGLHVIGTPKSIAEALLIKTTICILKEEGYSDLSLEINNVGGKESLNTFIKELNNYYKKHLSEMNSQCRQLFKDSAHSLILCKDQIKNEIVENAPSPLNFLSESNRNHFKEVVEYLESQEIPYEINKDILGDPNYSSHTVFSIFDRKTGKILATGTRYNNIGKKIGLKKDTPAISVSLNLKKLKKVSGSQLPKKEKIKFYFIQIGPEAKRKSLKVLDELRKAKVPVFTSLSRDRLSTQMQQAHRLKVPFVILMGQREALENSVVIRDMSTHKQDNVSISKLSEYIKKLK